MIEYIGKCLVIENEKKKIVVAGDIHIGIGGAGSAMEEIVSNKLYEEVIKDFEYVFGKVEKIDELILLGDLKHNFSSLGREERKDIVNLFDYLEKKCDKIVVIKGNHDNFLLNVVSGRNIEIVDYYLLNEYCFLHGDKDFEILYGERIKTWVMGHLHPAIKIREGNKIEKYRCFLSGEYKRKRIIILPSFIEAREGIDVRELNKELAWKFDLRNFEVRVVADDLKILDFGKLKKIK